MVLLERSIGQVAAARSDSISCTLLLFFKSARVESSPRSEEDKGGATVEHFSRRLDAARLAWRVKWSAPATCSRVIHSFSIGTCMP